MSALPLDDRIEALHDADQLWEFGELEDDFIRVRTAVAINYLQVFSLEQLAQIARTTAKDLQESGGVEYTNVAGKLNPESIKSLRVLLVAWRTKGTVSKPLMHIIKKDGTDLTAIHQITGIPLEELE